MSKFRLLIGFYEYLVEVDNNQLGRTVTTYTCSKCNKQVSRFLISTHDCMKVK